MLSGFSFLTTRSRVSLNYSPCCRETRAEIGVEGSPPRELGGCVVGKRRLCVVALRLDRSPATVRAPL